MPKHPRKKQKTSQNKEVELGSNKAARLELLLDEESKDDEERRLESLLFGVKYVPKQKGKGKQKDTSEDEDEDADEVEEGGGREMQHLLDQDLFFVDNGLDGIQFTVPKHSTGDSASETESEGSNSGSDSESDSSSSSSSTSSRRSSSKKSFAKAIKSSKSKAPAWVDPADIAPSAHVSLLSGPTRLRKLRQAVDEDEITGREYETRLRAQYERINPEPSWAKKGRGKKTKEDESDEEDSENLRTDGEGFKELLSSTSGLLAESKKKSRKTVVLPQGTLAIERVRDANHSVQGSGSGEVRALSFHPKPAIPVLSVATADRRIRLFNIDGHLSPLLTTLHVPSLPIVSNTSVLFHPEGNTMLLSGPRPFFYTYDLQQGTSTLHRRGLWGTGFDDTTILTATNNTLRNKRRRKAEATTGGGGKGGGGNTDAVLHTAFSPHTGSMLAVAGRGGNVHIVDWKSGAGQVIASLKCTSSGGGGGGGVQGLWWVPSSATDDVLGGDASVVNDEKHLAVLTGEAEVYIWDVAQRRCVRKWKDEGGYRGAGRIFAGIGGANGSMAIGSTSGFVNVYGSDSFAVPLYSEDSTFSSFATERPKLRKALGQLTTPVSTLKFNHDGQVLAMASKDKKDSMRLVHVPSLTAFGNWPTSSTPLGHVTTVDFSARSEYVAIGNTRGKVLLYHLKDYGAGGKVGGF